MDTSVSKLLSRPASFAIAEIFPDPTRQWTQAMASHAPPPTPWLWLEKLSTRSWRACMLTEAVPPAKTVVHICISPSLFYIPPDMPRNSNTVADLPLIYQTILE